MQLTRFSDLSLRVLMYLTQQQGDELTTSVEIAELFQVPHNHVIKVVHRLGKLGWVETLRGRNGGFRLAIDPAQLRLGRALRELETVTSLVDCQSPPCVLRRQCLLKGVLDDGLDAFYAALDRHTLADIVKSRMKAVLLDLHARYARA
jgi:Rrf2 family nitric oxide-sensitive transcriptional repressor